MRWNGCMAASVWVCALAASPAGAVPITWYFAGELTEINGSPPTEITVGTPFSGTFTYEPPIEDSYPDREDYARYNVGDGAFQVQIGSYQIISTNAQETFISITHSSNEDRIVLYALEFDTPLGFAYECGLRFIDLDSGILSSTDLPITPPPLEPLEISRFIFQGSYFSIAGEVLELTPEPTTLTLFLACALGLIRHRRPCR